MNTAPRILRDYLRQSKIMVKSVCGRSIRVPADRDPAKVLLEAAAKIEKDWSGTPEGDAIGEIRLARALRVCVEALEKIHTELDPLAEYQCSNIAREALARAAEEI
jgi:hypothetical protein